MRLEGKLDLDEIAVLRSATVALGGTLMVIVCPSSILARIWTSSLVREGCEVARALVFTRGVIGCNGGGDR